MSGEAFALSDLLLFNLWRETIILLIEGKNQMVFLTIYCLTSLDSWLVGRYVASHTLQTAGFWNDVFLINRTAATNLVG